jgi:hypothetical protein
MEHLDDRHQRIVPAIVAYSFERDKPIDEALFIDMVGDILSYARTRKADPSEICQKATREIVINSHCSKEKP